MHVLMPYDDSLVARATHGRLVEAGHQVHVCHDALDPTDGGYACSAVRTGFCPLESCPIDVTVVVRSHGGSAIQPEEDSVLCSVRHRIPLVVAGDVRGNPYQAWTAAMAERGDVVAAVERVVQTPLKQHSNVATRALAVVLDAEDLPIANANVDVWRRRGALQAVISTSPPLPREFAVVGSVEVHRALRAFDPWATDVDVSLSPDALSPA